MAGVDFEEGSNSAFGRGQTDCMIDSCLFVENEGTGLSFHAGTCNSRVVNSTFINNEFFNAPDPENLSVNNDIIGNTFINSGIDCAGGGELIENNIFNGDTNREYYILLSDINESYTNGHSRSQVFRGNYIKNNLLGVGVLPSGTFGSMNINSNNAIVESNQFINIFKSEGDGNVLFCPQPGYSFLNNVYKIDNDFSYTGDLPLILVALLLLRVIQSTLFIHL